MSTLEDRLKAQISRTGPISVAEYMARCLLDADDGYYTRRDPFGLAGDFITAPEVSQMFGELIGLCLAQGWIDQGRPERFLLVELGPGRGTLMSDILSATHVVSGFAEAAEVWLVEASNALREIQAEVIDHEQINWVDNFADLPDGPVYLVANEFFDALPVRQFQKTEMGWAERMVGIDNEKLVFGLSPPVPPPLGAETQYTTGDIFEVNPQAHDIMAQTAERIRDFGGVALVIDYGDWGSSGDTFQAVRHHKYVDVLCEPGTADLTAHVDFRALAGAADAVNATALTPQGQFLEALGITIRAERLIGAGAQRPNIERDLLRLTSESEMGALFKVLGFYPNGAPPLAGCNL